MAALPLGAVKAVAVGAFVGGAAAAAEIGVLTTLGFTAVGPTAGSWAAGWMSTTMLVNGVGISAGSWFAAAQSAAMGGAAILGPAFVALCGVAGAVVYLL